MNQNQFQIRKANLNDAQAITLFNQKMAMETEGITLNPETILAGATTLLNNNNLGFYLVIETSSQTHPEIIASLMVTTEWSDWRNGQFWWIQSVYVVPQWRRKGLYRAMYQTVKELSEQQENICGYRLYVENENYNAQLTYETVGMTQTHYKLYEEIKPGFGFE